MMHGQLLRLLFLSILVLGAACGGAAEEPAEPAEAEEPAALEATADLQPTEGSSVEGTVTFREADGAVSITAHVTGLAEGAHGFHIHEVGDCSAPDASSAGGHFNPDGVDHGGPDSETRHRGDLGNIQAGTDGSAHHEMSVDFVTLQEGQAHTIIGKAVIVHSGTDDFTTQPTGDAGGRLACGIITASGN